MGLVDKLELDDEMDDEGRAGKQFSHWSDSLEDSLLIAIEADELAGALANNDDDLEE